jgi:hypothetical protein
MDLTESDKIINEFRKYVIQQSRSNLTRLKKNASKRLYNSLKGQTSVNETTFTISFEMEPYGIFQDKGVSGKKKKYNTPYSYKDKMPPAKKLDKWIVKRGIAPRDKKGRLMTRKSLQYAIARGIYMNGIKPSFFFTKPFAYALKRLPKEFAEAYGLDIETMFNEIIKEMNNGSN